MSIWNNVPHDRLLAELSLWSADLARLADEIRRTEPYADLFHIDVADGHFSPYLLFFPDLVARLRGLTAVPFHVHLMAESSILPAQVDQFAEAGADLITVFHENGEIVPALLERIRRAGKAAGIAIGLDVPPQQVVPYLPHIELVTMMGTRIGVKGQELSAEACPRIRAMAQLLRKHGYAGKVKISADGAIRPHTVPELRKAGADAVVMGSLAYASADLQATFDWLYSLPLPGPEPQRREAGE